MKLLFFDDFKLGVLKGDAVFDVSHAVRGIPHSGPHDLISALIARFDEHKERLESVGNISPLRHRPPPSWPPSP